MIFYGYCKVSYFMYTKSDGCYTAPKKVPRCPKCGSTSITTGARGASFFRGFIGASKTVNRCSSCGYTWEPKRR